MMGAADCSGLPPAAHGEVVMAELRRELKVTLISALLLAAGVALVFYSAKRSRRREIGIIRPGQWVLVVEDWGGDPIAGAEVILRGQPERGNQLIPFEGYTGPGSLTTGPDGAVSLVLPADVVFTVDSARPALDNTMQIVADGYAPYKFSFYDLTERSVGFRAQVPPGTTSRPGVPIYCYCVSLRPVAKDE
jgi:hypothetical protein